MEKEILEQEKIIKKAENFISQLSINRFMYTPLRFFLERQVEDILNTLASMGFVIVENPLYFDSHDFEEVEDLLKKLFPINDFYDFTTYFAKETLKGNDVLQTIFYDKEIEEKREVKDVLKTFAIAGNGMTIGDYLPFLTLLEAQKALLGLHKACNKIRKIEEGINYYEL